MVGRIFVGCWLRIRARFPPHKLLRALVHPVVAPVDDPRRRHNRPLLAEIMRAAFAIAAALCADMASGMPAPHGPEVRQVKLSNLLNVDTLTAGVMKTGHPWKPAHPEPHHHHHHHKKVMVDWENW